MNRWILKTDSDVYPFEQLERERQAVWDGVSNPVALRHIRSMAPGDPLLIYHSGARKEIVGLARVRSAPYQDPKQKDPKLTVVDVEVDRRLPRTVSLAEVKADPALLETLVYLTEFPTAISGSFDARFLELPREVLVTVMRHHQKNFSVEGKDGKLAPRFVAVIEKPGAGGYGPIVLDLSAHSEDIHDWKGSGDAIIAFHGPFGAQSIIQAGGGKVSNGCIRMLPEDQVRMEGIPLGTPVDIVA